LGTICTGAAFVDANTGYVPIAQNGVGTSIQKSTDGGVTWTDDETAEPFSLLLLDIAARKGSNGNDNVAVVGALSLEFSLDGAQTFNSSLGPLGAGQCIRTVGLSGFAAVGAWGLLNEANGVAYSPDFGITYSATNISVLRADTRYGAFPSATNWYITAGDWPGEGADDTPCDDPPCGTAPRAGSRVRPGDYVNDVAHGATLVKKQGARVHLLKEPSGALKWAAVRRGRLHSANAGVEAPIEDWEAQIATTVDGGKTWKLAFSRMNQFYFNGIECSTDQHCCAVAEFQNNATSGGTYVWCTSDGGATWTDTFADMDPNSSLIDIAAVGPLEYWAVGGEYGLVGFKSPSFYHTTDGGVSWAISPAPASMEFQYAIAVDCAANTCWANLLDVLTQESSLARVNFTGTA